MADCKGLCETVDKTTLEWFKIQELGLVNNTKNPAKYYSMDGVRDMITGTWASDLMTDVKNYTWTTEIRRSIRTFSPSGFPNF